MENSTILHRTYKEPRVKGSVIKKAIIPTFALAVLSTVAFQETILAAEQKTTQYVQIDNGTLNLRKSASSSSAIISSLRNGTAVSVYAESNGWAKINVNGKVGFVSSEFISNKHIANSANAAGSTTAITKYVNVDNGTLNLRKSASASSDIISSLKNGTAVSVYAESNGWAKVNVNGNVGYVSTKFLKAKDTTSFTTQTVATSTTKYVQVESGSLNMRNRASLTGSIIIKLAKGTAVKVYSTSGGWAKIEVYGKTGYVSSAFLTDKQQSTSSSPATIKKTTKYVNVNSGSRLNVRKKPSSSAAIMTKLTNGKKVDVITEANGWAKIQINGQTGYVSSAFLVTKQADKQPVSEKPAKTITKYVNVNLGSTLNMRKTATTKASVLLKLSRGVQVNVYSEANGWAKIEAYGKIGYVSSAFLSGTKPAPGTTASNSTKPVTNPNSGDKGQTGETNTNTNTGSQPSTGNDTEQTKPGTIEKYVNVVYGSSLNMRAASSTKADIVTKLARGTIVTVIAEANGWSQVTANGKTGYVSTQFLSTSAPFNPNTTGSSVEKNYESYNLSLADMTKIQMAANPQTDKKYDAYIRADALTLTGTDSGIVNGAGWRVRGGAGTEYWSIGSVNNKEKLQILAKVKGKDGYDWYKVTYNKTWVNASPDDVAYYLNPKNFLSNTADSLQFLKLSVTANINVNEVNNRVLSGKGVLQGLASTFMKAGSTYGINEMYLIAHALLETNNGKSQLANGVQVNGKTVYNMYGIGAYDADPVNSGAQFAYNAGWLSPETAIIGGANFIANGYINAGQDTLYKMRWNPKTAATVKKPTHQYASDIGWAAKQVYQMNNLYSLIDSYKLVLDIPQYH
ncbi:SH3 domain-containing protein [Bacillus rubiinfantis]|uniref:SH3 domain-containing protein n=1 Tax=Bacillus rubiinfantis TaxID=1499680 RepID=UPI0009E4F8AD|nr:SH3 domain-containing protein [Bacillus rubiinfantis]